MGKYRLEPTDSDAGEELIQVQQNLVWRDTQCRQDLNAPQKETQCAIQVELNSILKSDPV